ncbi:hypothetical protein PFNF54_05067 [Plasmodium falciparum NF54]|uniref:Uncharacterized protein n=1 Tax=Plasmodium falciparum (isolate NF54) TaxID=5843 RepID=W7K967_PLAFO|nr:hypothetical protein PFNF54_05067 [Plasmodium falciparum NF54]
MSTKNMPMNIYLNKNYILILYKFHFKKKKEKKKKFTYIYNIYNILIYFNSPLLIYIESNLEELLTFCFIIKNICYCFVFCILSHSLFILLLIIFFILFKKFF